MLSYITSSFRFCYKCHLPKNFTIPSKHRHLVSSSCPHTLSSASPSLVSQPFSPEETFAASTGPRNPLPLQRRHQMSHSPLIACAPAFSVWTEQHCHQGACVRHTAVTALVNVTITSSLRQRGENP